MGLRFGAQTKIMNWIYNEWDHEKISVYWLKCICCFRILVAILKIGENNGESRSDDGHKFITQLESVWKEVILILKSSNDG